MALSPISYLLKPERLEPAASALSWLGRIVGHYAVPDATFTPAEPARLLQNIVNVSETRIADVTALMDNKDNRQLSLQLAGLASTFRSRGRESGVEFATTSIRQVRMQNHDKAFEAITRDDEVRADLARMLKPGGDPAYFIVGMMIWENATFKDSRSNTKGAGGSVQLPISKALAATTGVVVPDVDVEGKSESDASQSRSLSGTSEGSSIFAFEYRTVRRRIFSIGSNFTPRLGGYGGRIEKDKVFGHTEGQPDALPIPNESSVTMDGDEDGVSWADLVEEGELEVGSVHGLALAFD